MVNHRRCILHSTGGHPAWWNDKRLQRFDNFMTGLQSGHLLNDVQFQLFDTNDNGDIIKVRSMGAWVIVDNSYLNVPTCIPPMKAAGVFRSQVVHSLHSKLKLFPPKIFTAHSDICVL